MKEIEDRVLQDVYLTRKVKERLNQGALEKEYKEHLEQNPAQEEVRARHILVDTEQKAKNVITKLNGGADFATMAKENSSDGSAATGGDLGYFSKGDMVPEFAEAAFALKPGAYTKTPVQSQFGWHVIQVEDRRTKPQPTFDQMKDQLANDASQAIGQTIVEELRKDAKIERFGMDGAPLPK
jgi:peptidyl-prolyl cis-trans isomerase C